MHEKLFVLYYILLLQQSKQQIQMQQPKIEQDKVWR